MTIAQLLAKLRAFVLPIEHAAETAIHFAEKELAMIPQNISDALARIKAALSGASDNAQAVSALQAQVNDLTAQGQAKDAQIADLDAKLNDATQQLADIEAAVLAAAPQA